MPAPIAIQLYSVRDLLQADFEGTIRAIADMGYAGVETAGFPAGMNAEKAAKLFKSLGLANPCAHMGLPAGADKNAVIDEARTLGIRTIISGFGPDDFNSVETIRKSCERFNEAAESAASAGLRFAVHNHWWEFLTVDGRLVFDRMLELVTPEVLFELDTYWITVAGCSAPAIVAKAGKRAPLLHIKDGPGDKEKAMTAVGDGIVDFPAIVKAAAGNEEWLIVEMDRCDSDLMTAVQRSFEYLKGKGLGRGRG